MKVILASQSPRRLELLQKLGWDITAVIPDIDESVDLNETAIQDAAAHVAQKKARHVQALGIHHPNTPIIAADTIVISQGKILGKPADADDARLMLQELSGRAHHVITGVCILNQNMEETFSCQTEVTFGVLNHEDIDQYISTGAPLDKAGAYGIQDWIGLIGIRSIQGDYYNVMGLPVYEIWNKIKRF